MLSAPIDLVLLHDHTLFAESLAFVLADRGMLVRHVVRSPTQAVSAVLESRSRVCLTGLHFAAEREGGIDTARLIAKLQPETVVVLLVGPGDVAVLPRALAAGVRGVAHAQETVDRLVDVVRRAAGGEIALDPHTVLPPVVQAGPAADGTAALTPREQEVLAWLVDGATTEQIVLAMGITLSTARTHIQNVLAKLGVHSRLEAAAYAIRHDLVPSLRRSPTSPHIPSQPDAASHMRQRQWALPLPPPL